MGSDPASIISCRNMLHNIFNTYSLESYLLENHQTHYWWIPPNMSHFYKFRLELFFCCILDVPEHNISIGNPWLLWVWSFYNSNRYAACFVCQKRLYVFWIVQILYENRWIFNWLLLFYSDSPTNHNWWNFGSDKQQFHFWRSCYGNFSWINCGNHSEKALFRSFP